MFETQGVNCYTPTSSLTGVFMIMYANPLLSGHARQTLIESNRVKSICFRGMRVNADDADLQLLGIRLLECLCYNGYLLSIDKLACQPITTCSQMLTNNITL